MSPKKLRAYTMICVKSHRSKKVIVIPSSMSCTINTGNEFILAKLENVHFCVTCLSMSPPWALVGVPEHLILVNITVPERKVGEIVP